MKVRILIIGLVFTLITLACYHFITINNIRKTVYEYQRNNSSKLMRLYSENSQLLNGIIKSNSLKTEDNDFQNEIITNSILIGQKLSQLNHGLKLLNKDVPTNSTTNINNNFYVFITQLDEPLSSKEKETLVNYLKTTNKQISLNLKYRDNNYLFQNYTNWIDYFFQLEKISTLQLNNYWK